MTPLVADQWSFLVIGYLLTVAIEIPILLAGLSRNHGWKRRLGVGLWLTACTYPVVILVLTNVVWCYFGRGAYLVIAETFAPIAECSLFLWAFPATSRARDLAVIAIANLVSFGVGEVLTGC